MDHEHESVMTFSWPCPSRTSQASLSEDQEAGPICGSGRCRATTDIFGTRCYCTEFTQDRSKDYGLCRCGHDMYSHE
jgi:hypothetical protein